MCRIARHLPAQFLFHYAVTYWGHKLGINIESDMRRELFTRVQKQSFRFFDNNKTGHLVSRMTNDLMDIGEIAHHGPEDLFIAFMTLAGAFGIMLGINWQLAVMTFIIVPLMIYLSLYFSRKMSKAFKRMFADIADYNARVENNVSGIRVVQAFANEKHEVGRFVENNERFRLTKTDYLPHYGLELFTQFHSDEICFAVCTGMWNLVCHSRQYDLRGFHRFCDAVQCIPRTDRED